MTNKSDEKFIEQLHVCAAADACLLKQTVMSVPSNLVFIIRKSTDQLIGVRTVAYTDQDFTVARHGITAEMVIVGNLDGDTIVVEKNAKAVWALMRWAF